MRLPYTDGTGPLWYLGSIAYMLRHIEVLQDIIDRVRDPSTKAEDRRNAKEELLNDIGTLTCIASAFYSFALSPVFERAVRIIFETYAEKYEATLTRMRITVPPLVTGLAAAARTGNWER
jgi:hypothetical protein